MARSTVGPVPSFAAARSYATRSKPESVAIGDLNGDHKPDLATANSRANTVSVHTRTIPHAQLERSGLFVAAGHRVTFVPMADILRRLG